MASADRNGQQKGAVYVFVVPPPNVCLQDNVSGDWISWNSQTGDYQFTRCGKNGFVLTGTGKVGSASSISTLTDARQDRRVSAGFMTGQLTGSATVVLLLAPGVYQTFRVTSSNPHPTCSCP